MAPSLEPNGSLGSAPNGETSRFKVVANGDSPHDDTGSNDDDDGRPQSAPNRRRSVPASQLRDDIATHGPRRSQAPPLQRFKTEFAPRASGSSEGREESVPDWGARHGFEDHYQSEHIISQLANVSWPPIPPS